MDIIDELFGPETEMDRLAQTNHLENAEWIRDLVAMRDKRGLTQTQVGELMGVAQSTVARLEAGDRDMRLSSLFRYALAVNAKVSHRVTPAEKDMVVVPYPVAYDSFAADEWAGGMHDWRVHEQVQTAPTEVAS